MNPGDFCEVEPLRSARLRGRCLAGERAAFLECLQPLLAQRWVRSERAKGQVGRLAADAGAGPRRAGDAYRLPGRRRAPRAGKTWPASSSTAATTVLGGTADLTPAYWTGVACMGTGPQRLADRLETQRTALALPAQLARLQEWDRAARRVGYFDDGYAASQLWKEDWEHAGGDEAAGRAARLLHQLDPLRT